MLPFIDFLLNIDLSSVLVVAAENHREVWLVPAWP
jgi:hypothetical protein